MTTAEEITFTASDNTQLNVYRWLPSGTPVAVVHIAHGLAEHAGRYQFVANELAARGLAVFADDHRGHGKTGKNADTLGHAADSESTKKMAVDIVEMLKWHRTSYPGLKVFLIGHSMGSILSQWIMCNHGAEIDGVVLIGGSGRPPPIATVGKAIARFHSWWNGPKHRSSLIHSLSFEAFNKEFRPNRTAYDWLSRDEQEVDAYIADPLCGFVASVQIWYDLLSILQEVWRTESFQAIPKSLPVYIAAGSADPVGGVKLKVLHEEYRKANLANVTLKLYDGARHAIFGETNKREVMDDLLQWLAVQVPLSRV